MKKMSISEISPRIAANVAIAIEHIVLRAFKNFQFLMLKEIMIS